MAFVIAAHMIRVTGEVIHLEPVGQTTHRLNNRPPLNALWRSGHRGQSGKCSHTRDGSFKTMLLRKILMHSTNEKLNNKQENKPK